MLECDVAIWNMHQEIFLCFHCAVQDVVNLLKGWNDMSLAMPDGFNHISNKPKFPILLMYNIHSLQCPCSLLLSSSHLSLTSYQYMRSRWLMYLCTNSLDSGISWTGGGLFPVVLPPSPNQLSLIAKNDPHHHHNCYPWSSKSCQ